MYMSACVWDAMLSSSMPGNNKNMRNSTSALSVGTCPAYAPVVLHSMSSWPLLFCIFVYRHQTTSKQPRKSRNPSIIHRTY